jgi:hypothetical protein
MGRRLMETLRREIEGRPSQLLVSAGWVRFGDRFSEELTARYTAGDFNAKHDDAELGQMAAAKVRFRTWFSYGGFSPNLRCDSRQCGDDDRDVIRSARRKARRQQVLHGIEERRGSPEMGLDLGVGNYIGKAVGA